MDSAFALTFPCRLPRDPRGVRSSPSYRPMLVAGRDNRYSTGWSRFSPKTGRRLQCLSGYENALSYLWDVTPYVLDYREQYPWVSDDLLRQIRLFPDVKISRDKLRTVDFVLTLLREDRSIGYSVVSFKPAAQCQKPQVQRRLQSEENNCLDFGWTYDRCTEENLKPEEINSAKQIMSWAGDVPFDEVHCEAKVISDYVRTKNRGQPLDDLLAGAAFELNTSFDGAYQMFAAAVCLGYLPLKLDEKLSLTNPLSLL
jgi:hypothetical protein